MHRSKSLFAIAVAAALVAGCMGADPTTPPDPDRDHQAIDIGDLPPGTLVTRLDTGEELDLEALPAGAIIDVGDEYAPTAAGIVAHCPIRESWEEYYNEWVKHYGQICVNGSCFPIVFNILEDVECWRACIGTCKTCYTLGSGSHAPHPLSVTQFPEGNPDEVIFGEICNIFEPPDDL